MDRQALIDFLSWARDNDWLGAEGVAYRAEDMDDAMVARAVDDYLKEKGDESETVR